MMQDFMKMLQKRQREQGPQDEKKMKAKASMAKELSDTLGGDIAEDMKGMSKVTVASDSEQGLKKGLEKAEEVLEDKMDSEQESEDMAEKEEPEMEESSDDLKSQIEELKRQLEDLKKRM
jgi:phage shock protein A